MTPHRLGTLVGATFGLEYVVVNAGVTAAPWDLVLHVLAVLTYVAVLALVLRREQARPDETPAGPTLSQAERPGFGRGYWIVVGVEVVAFVVGNLLLNGPLDTPDGVLPWVTFVVLLAGSLWAVRPAIRERARV